MTATFPGGVKQFTQKTNEVDIVDAAHVNDLQDEVTAIETELLKTTGSVIDHGSLTGLSDNDHPQYVDKTSNETIGGTKTFSNSIIIPTPTANNHAATKAYIDASGGGGGGGITLQDVYPIGSIYMSMNSTNPSTALGFGTWSAILGKVLVGVNSAETEFNAAGKTGGSKTVTLTQSQMPIHNHGINCSASQISISTAGFNPTNYDLMQPQGTYYTGNAGSGAAHNNLQPYFAVYIWRRTA